MRRAKSIDSPADQPTTVLARYSVLIAGSIALVVATLVAYWPVYDADFINLDDAEYVWGNRRVIQGLTSDNLWWALARSHSANWHPLTWLSHMTDVELFGLDARGHHAVNVALHAVNVVLLFWILSDLTGRALPSLVVASVFALHPANVEVVAWVSQRKTLLSTLFALLAVGSYARYTRGSWRWYAASLVLYVLSLASKQMFVTLPFALLLLDYWPLERTPFDATANRRSAGWRRLVGEKTPYFLLAILASAATVLAQQGAMRTIESYSMLQRLGNVCIAYVAYVGTLIWPANLAVFYPLYPDQITLERSVVCLAILLLVSAIVGWQARRRRYLFVGWFWFLGTMVPVVGLVHVGNQSMADRYLYSTSWGLLIALTWSILALVDRTQRRSFSGAALAAAAGASAVFAMLTFRQAGKWSDSITLFQDAVTKTARNHLAHRVLAGEYAQVGDYRSALHHCEEGLRCGIDRGPILSIYGLALHETGSTDKAIDVLDEASRLDRRKAMADTNLGYVYVTKGDFPTAALHLQRAAERLREEDSPEAYRQVYSLWGLVLSRLNRPKDALEKLRIAVELDPDSPSVVCELADVEMRLGMAEQAAVRLRRVVENDPEDARAAYLLGNALGLVGRLDEALTWFQTAFDANPNHHQAAIKIAKLAASLGKPADGKPYLLRALDAAPPSENPASAQVRSSLYVQLGVLAGGGGQTDEAAAHFHQALAEWPDNSVAMNNLAWLLATHPVESRRDGKQAVALASRACELTGGGDYSLLGTLAAAYAADNRFDQALDAARKALALAQAAKQPTAVAQIQEQIRQHEQHQPYRDRSLIATP